MCLVLRKDTKISIAEEDLIVYKKIGKITDNTISSYNRNYVYEFDKLYVTDIKEDNSRELQYHDITSLEYYRKLDKNNLKSLGSGFHSYAYPERQEKYYTLQKCIIPTGSDYYQDETGLVISNKIIITKETIKY
jgi:hypothetical protein